MITEFDLEQIRLKFLQLSSDYDYETINWNEYYSNPDLVLPDPLGDGLGLSHTATTSESMTDNVGAYSSVNTRISNGFPEEANGTVADTDVNRVSAANYQDHRRSSRQGRHSRRKTDYRLIEHQCNSPSMVIDSDEQQVQEVPEEEEMQYSLSTADATGRKRSSQWDNESRFSTTRSSGRVSSGVAVPEDSDDGEAEYVFGESNVQSVSHQSSNTVKRRPVIEIVSDNEEDDEVFIDDDEEEEDVYYVDDDEADTEDTEYISDSDTSSPEPVKHSITVPIISKPIVQSTMTDNNGELSARQFARRRDGLLLEYYIEFNRVIFKNKLPTLKLIASGKSKDTETNAESNTIENRSTLPVPYLKWNKTLRKTAGITKMFMRGLSNEISVGIELSVKVCDNVDRLRKTLAHEMCHLATFWLHRVRGHGETFFRYGALVTQKYPDIPVTTCHSYAIQYKYHFRCKYCSAIVKRHSKSLKTESYKCKICGSVGTYELTQSYNQSAASESGTDKSANTSASSAPRTPSLYNLFVKQNFSRIRAANPHVAHKDLMKVIADEYKRQQQQQQQNL